MPVDQDISLIAIERGAGAAGVSVSSDTAIGVAVTGATRDARGLVGALAAVATPLVPPTPVGVTYAPEAGIAARVT